MELFVIGNGFDIAHGLTTTYRDFRDYIRWNRRFFSDLNNVDEINVIGHSLGEVDMPYFREIRNNVRKDTIWNVYYFCEADEVDYREKIISIGVNEKNIRMLKSEEFFNIDVV